MVMVVMIVEHITCQIYTVPITLWLFNIAMENGPFIDGLPVYLLKMVIFHGDLLVITTW